MAPTRTKRETTSLPATDNTSASLQALRSLNERYRALPWPEPFDETSHVVQLGDARDLSSIADESVHLVVTSPPYWNLKQYAEGRQGQMGDIQGYDEFLGELDLVWGECHRVLAKGGRICCVVGDVCIPRKRGGRHHVMPLHSDIQVRARRIGLDCLTPILWHKIANSTTEAQGNGAGFYGKPYQPGAIIKNDVEYILFLRKGEGYRSPTPMKKALSMLSKEEMATWLRSIWSDIRGASTREGHPAPFPVELAERLIRLFSFAGDTILDPFVGVGSTLVAALRTGRNSIGVDIEPTYLELAYQHVRAESIQTRMWGAVRSSVCRNGF